jgi:hypothetical protein
MCSVICTDTSCGTPNCVCASGYSGTLCEAIVGSVCQSNSCINGNCIALTNNTFQCQCNGGFFGTRCDLGKKREKLIWIIVYDASIYSQ